MNWEKTHKLAHYEHYAYVHSRYSVTFPSRKPLTISVTNAVIETISIYLLAVRNYHCRLPTVNLPPETCLRTGARKMAPQTQLLCKHTTYLHQQWPQCINAYHITEVLTQERYWERAISILRR